MLAESSLPALIDDRYLVIRPLPLEGTHSGPVRRILCFDFETRSESVLTTMSGDGAACRRFLAECEVVRQLTSPCVVKVLGSGALGDGVYLSSDFPATVSLRKLLGGGVLPRELACQILWQLATALVAFQGRGVVHGGIDPETIYFTPGGELILGGFLPAPARMLLLGMHAQEKRIRTSPPEWIDAATVLPCGDLYSLGLVMVELFTGEPLLAAASLLETRERQLSMVPELREGASLLERLPKAIRGLLFHFLQPDPKRRPQGILQVIPHLEAALAGTRYRALPGEVLRQRVAYSFQAEQRGLLEAAQGDLEKAPLLVLGAGISLASQMGVNPRVRPACVEALVALLWSSFLPRPVGEPRALCLLIESVATRLEVDALLVLARWRIKQLEREDPVLEPLLPERKIDLLAATVRSAPSNEVALLTIAIARPDLVDRRHASLPLLKGSLCSALGLRAAAVFHAAKALASPGHEEAAMELISPLFQAFSEGEALLPLTEAPPLLEEGVPALLEEELPGRTAPTRLGPDEVEGLLASSQAFLEEGRLHAAAEILDRLFSSGAAQAERAYSSLVSQINSFLWKVILNRGENRLDLALEPVIRIARSIGLHSMVPIGERLLVAAIPEAELPDRLECLLRESGASIPILQAASRVAASRGEDTEWVGHLAAAGEKFLEVGELTLASKMFMALRAMKPDSVLARRGMQGIIACGAQAVEAGKSFEILEGTLEKHQGNLPRSLAVCQEFLAKFPNHVPCLERTASLLAQQGNNSEAAQILLGLAKRSMYREEDEPARRYLQRVLQTDYECDEALLYLVALEPPGEEAPGEISEFKTWVFMREGLLEAAIYHTRKKLTGGATDLPLLHKILKLTETAGQDPGSVLLEAGRIAWEGRQIPLARKYFDSAYRATTDKAGLLDQLMRWEGIDEIFPMVDLLRVSTDPGKVLSLTEPGLLPPLSEPGILDPQ